MTTRALDSVQRRALRQRQLNRAGVYALAILLALWILLPIWLIGTMAFSTRDDVYGFPKQVAPIPFTTETMQFFIDQPGILDGTRNSIVVAVITLVLSTAIAAPAGYAISRYFFVGRDAYRLGILAVRAFPIVILAVPLAVTFIEWGMFDKVYSVALMHTALTLPTTILVVSSVFTSVPRVRLQRGPGFLARRAAAGAAGRCRVGNFHVRDVVERGVRRRRVDAGESHASGADSL